MLVLLKEGGHWLPSAIVIMSFFLTDVSWKEIVDYAICGISFLLQDKMLQDV